MKNGSVMKLLNAGKQFTKKHAPEIMTAVGIGSMVVAVGSAITSTPKAIANVEQAEKEKGESLTKVEVVKATWKCYIPTAVSFAAGTACLIGANSVSTRRTAAMAAAYKISETALTDLKEAVKESVDEEKVKEIRDKATKKKVDRTVEEHPELPPIIGTGKVLCYDTHTMQFFVSDKLSIKEAALNIKDRLHAFDAASLNDFIDEMIDQGAQGLKRNDVYGDSVGWNVSIPIDITFGHGLTDRGEPYLSVEYLITPYRDFDRVY